MNVPFEFESRMIPSPKRLDPANKSSEKLIEEETGVAIELE